MQNNYKRLKYQLPQEQANLGDNVCGSGKKFHLARHRLKVRKPIFSGEETLPLRSLEGKRGRWSHF